VSVIFSIRNISFSYPFFERQVLDNVSFDINEGDALTILGRNGAGKSTLLSCMLGLQRPQSGEIFLSGKNLRSLSEREIAATVGYVPQSHTPAFEHTVFDFVQMGFASRIGLFSRPGKKERLAAEAVLSEMGSRICWTARIRSFPRRATAGDHRARHRHAAEYHPV
jgi:iron complex transport system ATP-binding protein